MASVLEAGVAKQDLARVGKMDAPGGEEQPYVLRLLALF